MDKSTKIIINAGVGMINLTNKIWKKKFSQIIKEGKLEKDFGEGFLEKLESKVKKKQRKYSSFIKTIHKVISKSKKKNKSKKQEPVSKKTIVEFTLETFKESNKVWAKGFKQLIKEGKISEVDAKHVMENIDLIGKEQCESYLKDMATIISDSLGNKTNKKTSKSPNNAFDSILGMITIVRDSWQKNKDKKKQESTKAKKKETPTKPESTISKSQEKLETILANIEGKSELLETYEKRIQELEAKLIHLTGELNTIKKMQKESLSTKTVISTPIKKAVAKKASAKKSIIAKISNTNSNQEKDNLKKIEGIGPKIEALLHNAGILTFSQLSIAKTEAIKTILLEAGNRFKRHNPTTWTQQATLAAKGNWEALKKWQDELKGGK